jgi:hypothetical protein
MCASEATPYFLQASFTIFFTLSIGSGWTDDAWILVMVVCHRICYTILPCFASYKFLSLTLSIHHDYNKIHLLFICSHYVICIMFY